MNFEFRDVLLALLSAFLGSVKGLLVSQIRSIGAVQIFGLRSIGAVCFMLPIIVYYNFKMWYDFKSNLILLLRSAVGNIAVTGYYFGFVNLPLAEASLLFYSTPVFTVILGHFFLDERCGFKQTVSVFLSLTGVVLVCYPHFSFDSAKYSDQVMIGIFGCVVGAIAQAVALVIIRKITHIPPAVVSFWWSVVGILFSTCLCLWSRFNLWTCGLEPWYIIFIAVLGFVCELCMVAALKSTDAVVVSIALTFEIMCAFLFQIFINNETAGPVTLLGGAAIVISVILPPCFGCFCARRGQLDLSQVRQDSKNWK